MATSKKSPSRSKTIAAAKSPAHKKSSTSAAGISAGSAPAAASGAEEASSRVRVEADGSLRAPVPAPVMRRMGAEEGDNLHFRQLTPSEAKSLGVRSGSYVMSYKREGKR